MVVNCSQSTLLSVARNRKPNLNCLENKGYLLDHISKTVIGSIKADLVQRDHVLSSLCSPPRLQFYLNPGFLHGAKMATEHPGFVSTNHAKPERQVLS